MVYGIIGLIMITTFIRLVQKFAHANSDERSKQDQDRSDEERR